MRRLSLAAPSLLLALVACSPDFGLEGIEAGNTAPDTGTPAPEEEEEEEETTPPEEEEPEEETPPEEEEEENPPEEEEPPPEDDCTETDERVYVIERDDNTIYLFDPTTLSFEPLGRLSCPGGATPASMAVGRDGRAWVRSSDDELYQVSLMDLSCDRTTFRMPAGFDSFGMGFATEHDGTWRDHLYVADADSLGVLDTGDLSVDRLGAMDSQSELTGNALGELWAFLPLLSPARLVQIHQGSGAELERISLDAFPRASEIDAFAFATWGGEFWLFVRSYGMGNSTDVYRVTAGGTMTLELRDVGFDVVGAGVSTCAPTE